MKSLDEIGIAHQTDKASQFMRTYAKPHDYLRHMEPFFAPMRDAKFKLLEIGIGGGESARTWLEYFSEAYVFGVDIVQNTNPWNDPNSMIHPRYVFVRGDQGDESFWSWFLKEKKSGWGVVIDDGSHHASHVITTFDCLWPELSPGGIYIIEDLNTAYGGAPFTTPGQPTQMDLIKGLLNSINRKEREIERLHFTCELAILQKAGRR